MSTPRQTKADRFDRVITLIEGQIKARIEQTALAMRSQRPPDTRRVPPQEQLSNYLQIRDNPDAWQQIIAKRGVKSALKYRKRMEKLLKKTIEKVEKQLEEERSIPGISDVPLSLSQPDIPLDPAQIQPFQVQTDPEAAQPGTTSIG